jgi:hypothetical protein
MHFTLTARCLKIAITAAVIATIIIILKKLTLTKRCLSRGMLSQAVCVAHGVD